MTAQMQALTADDLATLRAEGIVLKQEFFPAGQISQIRDTVLRLRPTAMGHRKPARKWLLTSPSYAFMRCLRSAIRDDLVYLSTVPQLCGFREFSRDYYAQDVHLDHVMSIESPRCEDPITPWHTDANSPAEALYPPDYYTLKFFIYMNDINAINGAFSYVRGTHRLVTLIREGIAAGKIAYCRTNFVSELKSTLQIPEVIDYLLQQMTRVEFDAVKAAIDALEVGVDNPEDHALCGKAGTLLIFDDRGLHRGGIPRMDERSILRYNYMPTKYWRTTYTQMRYLMNMACRLLLPRTIARHW